MLRGEIRLVDLEPARGNEANTQRPAVVVSNDRADPAAARTRRGVVTVVPATGTRLRVDAEAQAEHVRSVAVERVGDVLGLVPADVLTTLDDAPGLRLHR